MEPIVLTGKLNKELIIVITSYSIHYTKLYDLVVLGVAHARDAMLQLIA